jgi:ADP-heptose:LPS heptosyltransferase
MQRSKLNDLKKIAILRPRFIGDLIITLPAMQLLKETYPSSEIVLLGKPWMEKFFAKRQKPFDRLLLTPPTPGVWGLEEGLQSSEEVLKTFFQKMQAEHFSIALQMIGGSLLANEFTRQLGAKLTVGFTTPASTVQPDSSLPYVFYQHELARYVELVSLLGTTTTMMEPRLEVTQEDLDESFRVLAKQAEGFVVLHPGANELRRRWPAEYFALLADRLIELGFCVVVTGSGRERDIVSTMIERVKRKDSIVNLCNALSLNGLVGLLKRAKLLISNDTGPRHIAQAVGTPTVIVITCADMINWQPLRREKNRVHISWRTNCPACGHFVFLVKPEEDMYPYAEQSGCRHNFSFVADVRPEEMLVSVLDLLQE